ncbi:MAG TPA: DUF1203 domain-containing protein [Thermoanaerobaculia bacterium]|nr:DUF1203 domain-containing protein [Thermoanaerobaculia bacterium]
MIEYRTLAIPQQTADAVRTRLTSPGYGHPAHVETAHGYGPCRLCLRFFVVGAERRILFTYDPFRETGAAPLPGPIYIHQADCPRYPEDAGFPAHLLEHPLTLAAYGQHRALLAEETVRDGAVEPVLQRLLARREVAYLHVRDTDAGCFDLRIERAGTAAGGERSEAPGAGLRAAASAGGG